MNHRRAKRFYIFSDAGVNYIHAFLCLYELLFVSGSWKFTISVSAKLNVVKND